MKHHTLMIAVATLLASASAAAGELPVPDVGSFRQTVAPLFQKYCIDCHGPDAEEGGLSLHDIDADLVSGSDFETWRIVNEQLRFGDMPPEDADQPSIAERAALLKWIRQELLKTQQPGVVTDEKLLLPQFGNYVDHRALFGKRLSRVTPAPPRLWRLRLDIYDRTMPRLAEQVGGLANGLTVRDGSDFKDYSATYFLDEAAAAPLMGNAAKIAERMVAPKSKDRVFKELVDESEPPDEAKVRTAIGLAFRKVLGRAATDEETVRFYAFYQKSMKTGGYQIAAKALLSAVLLQPEALYRLELGDGKPDEFGRVRLTPSELAYALSYALHDETIREFVDASTKGQLATREQIATAVRERLHDESPLQDRNSRILHFFREYFHYPFANEVFKDKPEGGTHNPEWLITDLETTIRDILREDRDVLSELLTTRRFHVLARYNKDKQKGVILEKYHRIQGKYHTSYSLAYDWKWSLHLQPVEFPADERAGVLTHPAWLAAWSGNFENHPVQRGKWIRTHLLGGTVPDVPIGVDARVPEKEHTTFRDRLALATSATECWRCHKKMDALGVPFERYDHYGRVQRLDAGQPVNARGEISRTGDSELDGTKVNGPTELMDVLARSQYVEQVFVRHAFRFFMGRNETLGDANTLQDAHKAYRDSDGSFNALVTSLLSSDSFVLRQQ